MGKNQHGERFFFFFFLTYIISIIDTEKNKQTKNSLKNFFKVLVLVCKDFYNETTHRDFESLKKTTLTYSLAKTPQANINQRETLFFR